MKVSGGLPGGAARAFDESELGVEVDGLGIVVADVKPDVVYLFFAGMLDGAFGEGTGYAPAAMGWMDGDVGDEVDALFAMLEGHEAGVADDASVFLPNVTSERKRCGFGGAVGPFDEGVVAACAAHILHVAFAFAVHGFGEA